MWSDENLDAIRSHRQQWQFSINLLVGILSNCQIGPHILQVRVGGRGYLNYLRMHLIRLLEDEPNTRLRARFQHDSALSRYNHEMCQWLLQKYPCLRIGRGRVAPASWPTLSPELNPLDCSFWWDIWIPRSLPVQSILERNCDVQFNNLQVSWKIYPDSPKPCDFLFHAELSCVPVHMKIISSTYC